MEMKKTKSNNKIFKKKHGKHEIFKNQEHNSHY